MGGWSVAPTAVTTAETTVELMGGWSVAPRAVTTVEVLAIQLVDRMAEKSANYLVDWKVAR
jgi:hypothetical protein